MLAFFILKTISLYNPLLYSFGVCYNGRNSKIIESYMKRTREHVLEEESKRALKNLLPPEWIVRDIVPDYGLDMEVTIVEGEDVSNKILNLQIKATENLKLQQEIIPLRMETKHLKYYENHPLPILILYYIKSMDVFYYLFAQRYIKENLSMDSPDWRKQKTTTIKFSRNSTLGDIENIISIVIDGYFYILQAQLQTKPEGATYWLDGIPKSDDKELKERTIKALSYARSNNFSAAIDEYENILRVCTVSPTERLSVLLNLGNSYYALSQYDNALKNYKTILDLSQNQKVSERSALEGKAAAFCNIGIIYRDKGKLDDALKYHEEALEIHREIGYKEPEASDLGNIGVIYSDKGKLDDALKYHEEALEIHREVGNKQGEANQLANIGHIFRDKGKLDDSLSYYENALLLDREIGYIQGEASDLGNIGLFFYMKGKLDDALKYHENALEIHKEIGYKEGEANQLSNLGNIFMVKDELDKALKYYEDALLIDRDIGYKQGEAIQLGNIGLIFKVKGELDGAIKYLEDGLQIAGEIGYKQGEANLLGNIGLIYSGKGELDNALKYLEDALAVHDRFNLIYGRDIIQKSIKSILKETSK